MNEMRLIRRIIGMLRKKHSKQIRLVDVFGGVVDNTKRSPYNYARKCRLLRCKPEVFAFKVAKKLERIGVLRIEFINGRNWLISQMENRVPWREFWNAL